MLAQAPIPGVSIGSQLSAFLRIVLAAACISAAGLVLAQEQTALAAISDSASPTLAGTVELVEGDVHITDNAKNNRTVKVGDAVNEGDSITTGKDGELHLNMDDGGFIAVRPNTQMRIVNFRAQGNDDDKGIFSLLQGSFRSITGWIGKFKPSAYQIHTPTATIGIRGTDHEPLVIPPDSTEGEPGTYDKVNAGGSYIQTPQGQIDVPPGKSAFAPRVLRPGMERPRLLERIPHFFRATRNEHLIERRHEIIQQRIQHLREERRQRAAERRAAFVRPRMEGSAPLARNQERRQKIEEVHRERRERWQQRRAEREPNRAERVNSHDEEQQRTKRRREHAEHRRER